MARSMRSTSRDAYASLGDKKTTQYKIILNIFGEDKTVLFSRQELSRLTGISINAICGRVNELVAYNKLQVRGQMKDKTTGRQQERLGLPELVTQ